MATTAGMAAGGTAAGIAIGSFADESSTKQQIYVANMILNDEHKIHIYPEKIYVGLNRLPVMVHSYSLGYNDSYYVHLKIDNSNTEPNKVRLIFESCSLNVLILKALTAINQLLSLKDGNSQFTIHIILKKK